MNKSPVPEFCFILARSHSFTRWGKDGNFLMDFLSNTISQKNSSAARKKKTNNDHEHTKARVRKRANDGNFHLQKSAYKIS